LLLLLLLLLQVLSHRSSCLVAAAYADWLQFCLSASAAAAAGVAAEPHTAGPGMGVSAEAGHAQEATAQALRAAAAAWKSVLKPVMHRTPLPKL
jgi:hypothetical protein